MSTAGKRFGIGVKAACEGLKELIRTGDPIKAFKKVEKTLEDYLENEKK